MSDWLPMSVDDDAFEAFFRAVWPRLFRSVWFVAGDTQVAEDAIQVAMTRACRKWSRVRAMASSEAYVRKIAMNEVLASKRKAARRNELASSAVGETRSWSPVTELEERNDLWSAVSTLPPRQRAVVVLRYYEDLSEQEIADTLGCRPGTVKSQASAALTTLRQLVSAPQEGGIA